MISKKRTQNATIFCWNGIYFRYLHVYYAKMTTQYDFENYRSILDW